MNQSEFLMDYNKTRRQFNPELFERDDMKLVETIVKLIKSCERDKGFFKLKLQDYSVETSYSKIMETLRNYEQETINRKNKKNIVNRYDNITLANSAVILLTVDYYIEVPEAKKEKTGNLRVYILLPKIVDKYYYLINGKLYSAIYQIVDGSIYNNSSYESKIPTNSLKMIFTPMRVYRFSRHLNTITGDIIEASLYSVAIFTVTCYSFTYFLAKFGFEKTCEYFGFRFINITKSAPNPNLKLYSDKYIFERNGIYIIVPKVIFDNDKTYQSLIATLDFYIENKKATREDIFNNDFWLDILSSHFYKKNSLESGQMILNSFEYAYDLCTNEDIRLPDHMKKDMYDILKWIITEFEKLKQRDIVDVNFKRVRREEYIGSIYINKLIRAIILSSDNKRSITVEDIKRYINTAPDLLLNRLVVDRLVTFRNTCNDMDSITALKYSYKGVSGLGEKKGSAIKKMFKMLPYTSLGKLDPDSSSNSDPGITGILAPMGELHDGYFSDYQEPCSWDEDFKSLEDLYLSTLNKRNAIIDLNSPNNDIENELDKLDQCLDLATHAMNIMVDVDNSTEYVEGMVIINE